MQGGEGGGTSIQQQLNTPENCNVVYEDFVCHLPTGHTIGKVNH